MARIVARGDVRLVQFPAPDKRRPALVLTRAAALGCLVTATVAPITTTIRGVPSEVLLGVEDGMKGACVVNLHNLATVPQTLLGARVAQLSPDRMRDVCAALAFVLGCEAD